MVRRSPRRADVEGIEGAKSGRIGTSPAACLLTIGRQCDEGSQQDGERLYNKVFTGRGLDDLTASFVNLNVDWLYSRCTTSKPEQLFPPLHAPPGNWLMTV